jgi:hypothetical protein
MRLASCGSSTAISVWLIGTTGTSASAKTRIQWTRSSDAMAAFAGNLTRLGCRGRFHRPATSSRNSVLMTSARRLVRGHLLARSTLVAAENRVRLIRFDTAKSLWSGHSLPLWAYHPARLAGELPVGGWTTPSAPESPRDETYGRDGGTGPADSLGVPFQGGPCQRLRTRSRRSTTNR